MKSEIRKAKLFFLLGLCAFLGVFYLKPLLFFSYTLTQLYYAAPVTPKNNTLTLRHDSYGEGYFGASRNGHRFHKGVDFKSPLGAPVFASKSGRVITAANKRAGYGLYVVIAHPDGKSTLYSHLKAIEVKEGEWVRCGQTIALTGKTGNANYSGIVPHLHFEIRDSHENALNPTLYLNPSIVINS